MWSFRRRLLLNHQCSLLPHAEAFNGVQVNSPNSSCIALTCGGAIHFCFTHEWGIVFCVLTADSIARNTDVLGPNRWRCCRGRVQVSQRVWGQVQSLVCTAAACQTMDLHKGLKSLRKGPKNRDIKRSIGGRNWSRGKTVAPLALLEIYLGFRCEKASYSHTIPTPLNSAGAWGQHRCTSSSVDRHRCTSG